MNCLFERRPKIPQSPCPVFHGTKSGHLFSRPKAVTRWGLMEVPCTVLSLELADCSTGRASGAPALRPAAGLGPPNRGDGAADIVLSECRNKAVVSTNVNICTTTMFYSLQFNGKNLP